MMESSVSHSVVGAELSISGAVRCGTVVAFAFKATSVRHNSFSSCVCLCVCVCVCPQFIILSRQTLVRKAKAYVVVR